MLWSSHNKDELGADGVERRNEENSQYQVNRRDDNKNASQTTDVTFLNSQTRRLYVRSPDDEVQSKLLRVGLFISHLISKSALLGKLFNSRIHVRNGFTRVSPHIERQHCNTIDTDTSTGTGMMTLRESMRDSTKKFREEEFGIESPQTEIGTLNDNMRTPENGRGGLVSSATKTNEMALDHQSSSEYKRKVSSLPFYRAFLEGYLLPFEYAQLASITTFLCLILFFGLLISSVLTSSWVGHIVWCSIYILIFTAIAGVKVIMTKSSPYIVLPSSLKWY